MRRIRERRRPKAHPARGRHERRNLESCYRCRHGRSLVACACRYARRATTEPARGWYGRCLYAGRLAAGLVLLAGRRFGPGVALVAARGVLPKLAPALAALPALAKSAWVWLAGFSLAAMTALSVGSAPAPPAPGDPPAPAATECASVEAPSDAGCRAAPARDPAAPEARRAAP